ncbi:MAG: glycoside hydrolase family 88 protein [Chloroflexota bacterium]|nr:glycoside hydrolase family 88 protein [Chloroflexota bacterium]MDE2961338.1 glycoside hydrolase family 88 protein [Chloroflexota bacterium]
MSTMHPTDINAALVNLVRKRSPGRWQSVPIGLTPLSRPLLALIDTRTLPFAGDDHRPTVLLVAGLRGETMDTPRILVALDQFARSAAAGASGVALSALAASNPDALAGGDWEPAAGNPTDLTRGFPPDGGFYSDETGPESRYLWRWVCYQAPDLIVEVALSDDPDQQPLWEANAAAAGNPAVSALAAAPASDDDSLVAALGRPSSDSPGVIPSLRLTTHWTGLSDALHSLWRVTSKDSDVPPSQARLALNARRSRTPVEIARILAGRYGHALDPVNYTQGVGISGRLRLAALDDTLPNPTDEIAAMIDHIAADPAAHLANAGGATLAGVVWAARLADYTGDEKYRRLFFYAADRFVFRGPGEAPAPCDPDFRVEDMFMTGAMLGRAFRISGDPRYADLLANFLLNGGDVQQSNGLFHHARSAPFYWSRGNGFAALGYAEALTYLPEDHPARDTLLRRHRQHLDALIRVQQPWGTFGELVDLPGAWSELTSTSMVGYALARGLRLGWLPSDEAAGYTAGLRACWRALSERIDEEGGVVDGCISTGVMPDARAYLNRAAVNGYDDRTGSLALWFACEMAHQP